MTKTSWPVGLTLLLVRALPLYAAEPAAKPNIVFVLFDDMGYGQPPC